MKARRYCWNILHIIYFVPRTKPILLPSRMEIKALYILFPLYQSAALSNIGIALYIAGCWRSHVPLHWRHNDHDGVSNHQPHGCLLNRLFRRRSKKTSKLRVTGLCEGNSPGPVNSPHKGPVTRKMFPFDDVIMLHQSEECHVIVLSNEWECELHCPT